MLLDSTQAVQYFIRLPSGQEIGPYTSVEQARISLATMPVFEDGEQAAVFPKTVGGAQVLFG